MKSTFIHFLFFLFIFLRTHLHITGRGGLQLAVIRVDLRTLGFEDSQWESATLEALFPLGHPFLIVLE
jgi:hypothetical protein